MSLTTEDKTDPLASRGNDFILWVVASIVGLYLWPLIRSSFVRGVIWTNWRPGVHGIQQSNEPLFYWMALSLLGVVLMLCAFVFCYGVFKFTKSLFSRF